MFVAGEGGGGDGMHLSAVLAEASRGHQVPRNWMLDVGARNRVQALS